MYSPAQVEHHRHPVPTWQLQVPPLGMRAPPLRAPDPPPRRLHGGGSCQGRPQGHVGERGHHGSAFLPQDTPPQPPQ